MLTNLVAIALLASSGPAPAGTKPAAAAPGAPLEARAPQFFAVSVPDVTAAAKWYRDVFAVTLVNEIAVPDGSLRIAILRSPALVVELLQQKRARPLKTVDPALDEPFLVHGIFKVGFFVDDLDAVIASLRQKGVALLTDIVVDEPSGVRFVLLQDNSGNLLQIFQTWPKPR